ncbi:MAG: hypothetical protein QF691_13080, partial [SAR324 cluster bacterium]|nr:hypothetical protein [SAR324 cluster bacterium]
MFLKNACSRITEDPSHRRAGIRKSRLGTSLRGACERMGFRAGIFGGRDAPEKPASPLRRNTGSILIRERDSLSPETAHRVCFKMIHAKE